MIDHVALTYRGKKVTAGCHGGPVTTVGLAPATNARWHITVDGVTQNGFEAAHDDTEESVRAQIVWWLLERDPDPVVPYKGHLIRPRPHQLRDSGEWVIDGQIWKQDGGGMDARPFSSNDRYHSREEALRHTLLLGQRFVDDDV
jgi:hypothetical protein